MSLHSTSDLPGGVGRAVNRVLEEGESVLDEVLGSSGMGLTVTDRRVILVVSNFMVTTIRSAAFAVVRSIDIENVIINAMLKVRAVALQDEKNRRINEVEMSISIDGVKLIRAREVVARVRRLVEQAQNPAPMQDTAKTLVDDLERLARLRDSGALTPEEFEIAKHKLLF